MIYFTSDWHIGHENVIKYCNRPFANADKMRHTILGNYNKVVTEEDIVYFLGDMTLVGPANKQYLLNITKGLPGTKHLILGNHDKILSCGEGKLWFWWLQKRKRLKMVFFIKTSMCLIKVVPKFWHSITGQPVLPFVSETILLVRKASLSGCKWKELD